MDNKPDEATESGEWADVERMVGRAISFRGELTHESDRGCALLAASYLDDQLRELLVRRFVDAAAVSAEIFEGSGPLATFSSRIDLAFLLGLIGAAVRRDLHLVRKIRNEFAHEPIALDFKSPAIASRCRELYHRLHANTRPPRATFTEGVMGVLAVLHAAIREAKPLQSPADLDLSEKTKKSARPHLDQLVQGLMDLAENDADAPMRTLKERTLKMLRAAGLRKASTNRDAPGGSHGSDSAPHGPKAKA